MLRILYDDFDQKAGAASPWLFAQPLLSANDSNQW